jgi:hypothetical protein
MHDSARNRAQWAILRLIAQFPGLLGPVAIQAALKTMFGLPAEQSANAGQYLVLLETAGMISSQDLGKGRFVYRLTNRGAHLFSTGYARRRLRTYPRTARAEEDSPILLSRPSGDGARRGDGARHKRTQSAAVLG